MGKNILGKIDTWLALWFIGYAYYMFAVCDSCIGNKNKSLTIFASMIEYSFIYKDLAW